MMRNLMMTTILALAAGPLWADDAALILGNERYDRLDRVLQGDDVSDGALALSRKGVRVASATNANMAQAQAQATAFIEDRTTLDGQIVVLSGRFATDGQRSWFLTRDAQTPTLFNVGQSAISLETVLDLLADTPGQAVLMLGYDEGATGPFDINLREGIGELDIPQGVTVVMGRTGGIANLLSETLDEVGNDLIKAVPRHPRLSALGYLPQSLVLFGESDPTSAPSDRPDEQVVWNRVRDSDDLDRLRSYVRQFPNGQNVDEARAKIRAIENEPNREARLREERLNISRSDRRAIQRDLNVLEYDTRGIDGIFGPGSRRAITNWQQQNGFAQTSYLTSGQITRLDAQAARRSQEQEAAAERQRQAELARDRAYWEETGAKRDRAGLRAYLRRYPDGTYSDRAEAWLEQIRQANRAQAREQDRAAWDAARERNTQNGYRLYLSENANGSFRDEAEDRIAALQAARNEGPAEAEARSAEAAMRLDPLTLRLIEARLDQLGLEPGQVDGNLDNQSRRALRRYQRDRNLDRTGYLTQATVSRLLRDAFR